MSEVTDLIASSLARKSRSTPRHLAADAPPLPDSSIKPRSALATPCPNRRHFSGVTTAPFALANGISNERQVLSPFTLLTTHADDDHPFA